jgi:hypothetical protein
MRQSKPLAAVWANQASCRHNRSQQPRAQHQLIEHELSFRACSGGHSGPAHEPCKVER